MPSLACGPFLLALLLAGCGEPSAPSAEENRQLDEAARMLDAAPDTLANIDENGVGDAESNSVNLDPDKAPR